MVIQHYPNLAILSLAAADLVAAAAAEAVARRDLFIIALSGGTTPRLLYQALAGAPYRDSLPWDRTHFFWTDERCVPPNHPDSNYRLAWETLLSHLPLAGEQIHRLPGEVQPPGRGAEEFERKMRNLFAGRDLRGGFPVFDLVLLGVGLDGHTASLFPGRPALQERERWVVAEPQPGRPPFVPRLTLTLPVLNAAREVVFLVAGKDKQAVLERPEDYPAGCVRADKVLWLVTAQGHTLAGGCNAGLYIAAGPPDNDVMGQTGR